MFLPYPIIEVELHPNGSGKYRVLDGAHRVGAYKQVGQEQVEALVITLNGRNPLLYAAQKALGPKNLGEKEVREMGFTYLGRLALERCGSSLW